MCLDQEVDEIWPHVPLDLTLHVDEVGVWQGLVLDESSARVNHDIEEGGL